MSQPPDRLHNDPVRIVYHAGNRTFARLFDEHSLEQVKDVVRRKLGLGRETDVSLKQMGPDAALLDLEDDDDFQAFRIFLGSSVSADIQVTVGKSQGSTVPPPHTREQPYVTEPLATSPSEEPVMSAAVSQHSAAVSLSVPSAATKKTQEPIARKRKVSFSDVVGSPEKHTEQRAQSKTATASPVSSAKTAEATIPKSVGVEGEPPKKKRKKECVMAKDVRSPLTKSPSAPKSKVKKSATLDRESEVGSNTFKDNKPSEPPAKKPKKQKKDGSTLSKKSTSAHDHADQPISQPSNSVEDTSLQPASEKPSKSSGASKTRQSEKAGVCATIPRTNASTSVQSEVAASILSDLLSKASETMPPAPAPQRKSVKKGTKKSSASSKDLLGNSTTVTHPPTEGIPNVSMEQSVEYVPPTTGPPCPICQREPFHIRLCCPIVLKGSTAIRERLEEVKRTNGDDQQSLIKELEDLLGNAEVASEPSSNVPLPHGVRSREASQLPNVSLSQAPTIPSNSNLSEVIVENRDEGSSSESSDDMSAGRIRSDKKSSAPGKRRTPDKQLTLPNDDLEAVIRGPTLKRQSILGILERIVQDEDDNNSDSEADGNEGSLDEDLDEKIDRSQGRSSSDSESEEEESRSHSLSLSAKDDLESGMQGSDNPVERTTEHQDNDIVMKDGIDPPVREAQDDDSSEETHVGSEDRMVVVDSSVIAEEQLSSPVPRVSHAPGSGPQESGQTEVDPASNRKDGAPVAAEITNEVETDPIEPADDHRATLPAPKVDLIEDPFDFFTGLTQSTPDPGVMERIKTRDGQILDDEAERPVLLEQLDLVTPVPMKVKLRKNVTEMSASQESGFTRSGARFTSSTSTPAAVALTNHRTKEATRSSKVTKTPAKRSEQRQSIAADDNGQNRACVAQTPSLIRWETIAASSSSPSLELDEPSMLTDELMSSPQLTRGRSNIKEKKSQPSKPATFSEPASSQGKERLFHPSSSQIPFPYSQQKKNPAPAVVSNGKAREEITDSKKPLSVTLRKPPQYRSLSQLASEATLFSPSLPTPVKSNSRTKDRAVRKESSSSSSSSEEDEAKGSEHIPRGRRAGSVLESRRKKKSILSRMK